jgi:hypothetical protein
VVASAPAPLCAAATQYWPRSKELQFLRRPWALLMAVVGIFFLLPAWQLEVEEDEDEPAEALRG